MKNIPKVSKEKKDHSRSLIKATLLVLVVLTIVSFINFDTKGVNLLQASKDTLKNIRVMFFEAKLTHVDFAHVFWQIGVTFATAVITTLIAAVFSLILGLLASANLSNKSTSNVIKSFVALIRSVPTILWVLIFAISAGLGSEAAVIGLSFHAIGYLVKAYSEVFEEMDMGPIEALRSTGASWWQVIFQAVIPQCASYLIAWTFMRFEINYKVAIAVGAAAGAGGIGHDLFWAQYYYDIREVGMITILIIITVLILELIAVQLKSSLEK